MSEVDRIHPVTPAGLQVQVSTHVQMRKQSDQQRQPPKGKQADILELHTSEEEEVFEETYVSSDDEPEHGLDLTA